MPKKTVPGIWNLIPSKGKNTKYRKGFTLIELLVVISVIGILATFAIASLSATQARGRDAQRKNDFNQIKKALQMYYNDNGHYPTTSWLNSINTPGAWIADLTPEYIKELPNDPKNFKKSGNSTSDPNESGNYSYAYTSITGSPPNPPCIPVNGEAYLIYTRMENPNSANTLVYGPSACTWGSAELYGATNP